jgi:hypothetical protein
MLNILTCDANFNWNATMDPTKLVITPDAYNAWLLRGVIEATAQAGETSDEAHIRSGAIIEMFKCFAPRDAVEAMIASHCVHLRLLLQGAMRDAESPNFDAKMLKGMRASAMSVSRTLHLWVTKLETMKARNDQLAAASAPNAEAEQPRRRPAEEMRRPVQEVKNAEPANVPPRTGPVVGPVGGPVVGPVVGPLVGPVPARPAETPPPPPLDPFARPVFAARPSDQPPGAAVQPAGVTPRPAPT